MRIDYWWFKLGWSSINRSGKYATTGRFNYWKRTFQK